MLRSSLPGRPKLSTKFGAAASGASTEEALDDGFIDEEVTYNANSDPLKVGKNFSKLSLLLRVRVVR
jgi:hypothetical protein